MVRFKKTKTLKAGLIWGLLAVSADKAVLACAVCFGNPDSVQTKGAMAGVLLLLGVITTVLILIAAFIFHCRRRARLLEQAQEGQGASIA